MFSKGYGTIYPIMRLIVSTFFYPGYVFNKILKLIRVHPQPIERVFHAEAIDIHEEHRQTDPSACVPTRYYNIALLHICEVVGKIARSYLQSASLLLYKLLWRKVLLCLLSFVLFLCHRYFLFIYRKITTKTLSKEEIKRQYSTVVAVIFCSI